MLFILSSKSHGWALSSSVRPSWYSAWYQFNFSWLLDHSFAPLETWGAIYTKGQYADKHTHWPAIWSWVYNVECCNDCAPLEFNDANISIKPKIGNFILFPGWVTHSVPKQQCNHEKSIFIFTCINFIIIFMWSWKRFWRNKVTSK